MINLDDIRQDADLIMKAALKAALPDFAVKKALVDLPKYDGKLYLVAIGKAAWQMANSAWEECKDRISDGIVITKHGHSLGPIGNLKIYEAGHPVPDKDTYSATQEGIELVGGLCADDLVLFLISGGGSALFELPLILPKEMDDITHQLLACGADIVEINTIRKRLSAVKGGKFAKLCAPAKIFSIVLSDVLGDPLDMIASGPAYPDSSTCDEALSIVEKYGLNLSPQAMALLGKETPKALDNVETRIIGSVRSLVDAAAKTCVELGYKPIILTDSLNCEAKCAGSFLAAIARYYRFGQPLAFIAGGETYVRLTGNGLGGRNQEIALSAAKGIVGLDGVVVFSLGSDGTDGPTDAAGGIVDGFTCERLKAQGLNIDAVLQNNDSYHALKAVDGLIFTGPTGTNVNDLSCVLIKG